MRDCKPPVVLNYLYEAYAAQGMYGEAVAEFVTSQTLSGESPSEIQAIQESFAKSGWKGFLQHRLE